MVNCADFPKASRDTARAARWSDLIENQVPADKGSVGVSDGFEPVAPTLSLVETVALPLATGQF